MIPLLLAFGLFVFWTILGRALIALVYPRYAILRAWLLAPATGLSGNLLLMTWCSQWGPDGIPAKVFALPLLLVLAVLSLAVFLWKKPLFPSKQMAFFLGLALASLVYAGWPHFRFGFDWISYANDDMANYCLAASRTIDSGFYQIPTAEQLGGSDYSQYFFFMHVSGLIRFGSELLLSWVAATCGLNPLFVFMPSILALGLVQIWSLAALLLWRGRDRRLAYGASALLAASPLFGLGLYYQLIAQVGGLGLMLACLLLACDIVRPTPWKSSLRKALLLSLVAATLCVFYPEVTPFTGLALIFYIVLRCLRQREWPANIPVLFLASALTFLLLWENSLSYFYTLASQATASFTRSDSPENAFPFFLVPSGIPTFFGWISMGAQTPDSLLSVLIVLSFFLLALVTGSAFFHSWKLMPWACLLSVMVLMALQLFRSSNSAFSLFKMAMFLQPALAAALAVLTLLLLRRRAWIAFGLYTLALSFAWLNYARASLGLNYSGFCQLPLASSLGLHNDNSFSGNKTFSDVPHIVAIKIAALLHKHSPLFFPTRGHIEYIAGYGIIRDPKKPIPENLRVEKILAFFQAYHPRLALLQAADPLACRFSTRNSYPQSIGSLEFSASSIDPESPWIIGNPAASLLNKVHPHPSGSGSYLLSAPGSALANHLLFIESRKGKHYYGGKIGEISIHQAEADYFNPGGFFNGLGRFFVFQIINPSPELWLRINFSRSLQGNHDNTLPTEATLLARSNIKIPFVGAGSANIYVGPFQPLNVKGSSYFGVDFGIDGKAFSTPRTGLVNLFGEQIPFDSRSLIGFGRDFSVLSAEQYQALVRPRKLDQFPSQLVADSGLEYSGLYEDGWISPEAFFILGPSEAGESLQLKGQLPGMGDFLQNGNRIRVRLSGGKTHEMLLKPGNFTLTIPCEGKSASTRVDISFERSLFLPGSDGRPVGAFLSSARLGHPAELLQAFTPPTRLDQFNRQLAAKEGLEHEGFYQDGWVNREAFCVLGPSRPEDIVRIKGRLPKSPPFTEGGNVLTVKIHGGKPQVFTLQPGEFTVEARCHTATDRSRIELSFEKGMALKAPDTRNSSARLSSIEIIRNPSIK